jgi:hypothetical protein
MAGSKLRALLVTLALSGSACSAKPEPAVHGSVTVKLPAARPHAPSPAFSFKAPARRP